MEEKALQDEPSVGVGTVLAPGSYRIESEVLLLRVRLNGSPLVCLVDEQRRVKEILMAAAAEPGQARSA